MGERVRLPEAVWLAEGELLEEGVEPKDRVAVFEGLAERVKREDCVDDAVELTRLLAVTVLAVDDEAAAEAVAEAVVAAEKVAVAVPARRRRASGARARASVGAERAEGGSSATRAKNSGRSMVSNSRSL